MLLHEFEGEGVVDVYCADMATIPITTCGFALVHLRITAVTLDWFAEVPLTR
jgi:hypothetical protein